MRYESESDCNENFLGMCGVVLNNNFINQR
jgi:hypothetical protein